MYTEEDDSDTAQDRATHTERERDTDPTAASSSPYQSSSIIIITIPLAPFTSPHLL